jgi:hypothetical protein
LRIEGRHILDFSRVDAGQVLRVAGDCLLLKVADEAVGGTRPEQVREEIQVEEYALRSDDQTPLEPIGRCQVGKGHKVSALVLRLDQKRLDPVTIIFETPQGLEVRKGTADYSENCSHCFQNDGAMAVAALKERVGQESKELHAPKGEPVGEIPGVW